MGRAPGSRALRVLGWIAAGGMGAVTAARFYRSTSEPLLIAVQGVAGWALLPAFPLAGLAIWSRQIALSSVAVALAGVQVTLAAGALGGTEPQPLGEDDVRLRLVSANVLFDNPDLGRLSDDIAAEGADVVVLQEVTPEGVAVLRSSTLWDAYPYRALAPAPQFHGSATFSRFPIVRSGRVDVGGRPMLSTDLETPAGPVRVVNVHTIAPLNRGDARTWAKQFPDLARLVTQSAAPVVLAGDFNATLDHAPLDELVRGGVRDAFSHGGSGLGATWPAGRGPLPPLMQLDHVLVSDAIDVGDVAVRHSAGSDHRRLVVELGLPGTAARQPGPDVAAGSGAADGSNR